MVECADLTLLAADAFAYDRPRRDPPSSQVRNRLPAGGGRIRTLGPPLAAFWSAEITCRLQRSERAELVGAQADRRRYEILLEMSYRGRPGNWQHCGGTLQQPGQRDLARSGAVALGDPGEERIWAGEPARCQRVPGNKGDAGRGAYIDQ